MDRKQKIMRLIIDTLGENEDMKYHCQGAAVSLDPHLISLDFTVKKGAVRGELNVRGLIDVPLQLKAQYDNRTLLNDHPLIRRQIAKDLLAVSEKINRVL